MSNDEIISYFPDPFPEEPPGFWEEDQEFERLDTIGFTPKQSFMPRFELFWEIPPLDEAKIATLYKNLETVYSPYAIGITDRFSAAGDVRQHLINLVNLAGFRDHYGESWINRIIPTTSNVSLHFSPEKFRLADQLKNLFEGGEVQKYLAIQWGRSTGQIPDESLIKELHLDTLRYGLALVKSAMEILPGPNKQYETIDPYELYIEWIVAAAARNWERTEEIIFRTNGKNSRISNWGVPKPHSDLPSQYFTIKFGPLNDLESAQLTFLMSELSIPSILIAMSQIDKEDFSMEKLVVASYLKENRKDIRSYLLKFEVLPMFCLSCRKDILQFEKIFTEDRDTCYICNEGLEYHNYEHNWNGMEEKYKIRLMPDDSYGNICHYCKVCGTHYH